MATVRDAIDRAGSAIATLVARGESIEDEWQYVVDLEAAWRARLDEVSTARGHEPVEPAVQAAIERASVEAESIQDPHRAIDWLSTLPQIVLVALGEGT